jgi:hypothetical protein
MPEILWLIFLHLLADYPLQGQFISDFKGKNQIIMITHVWIWTGFICLGLFLLKIPFTNLEVILLFTVHYMADTLKAKNIWFYKKLNPLGSGLLVDQLIHVAQIVAVIYL